MTEQQTIAEVLTRFSTWAIIGCSPDPRRDSHRIARLLKGRGYRIIPVNPKVEELLGERAYPSLRDIPRSEDVEVVDVFRRSALAGAHVDEAIDTGREQCGCSSGSSTRRRPSGPEPPACRS